MKAWQVFLLPLCCVNAFATSSLRAITLGLVAEAGSSIQDAVSFAEHQVGCEQWRGRMFGGFFCAKHLGLAHIAPECMWRVLVPGLALGCFFSPWLSLHRVFWLEARNWPRKMGVRKALKWLVALQGWRLPVLATGFLSMLVGSLATCSAARFVVWERMWAASSDQNHSCVLSKHRRFKSP